MTEARTYVRSPLVTERDRAYDVAQPGLELAGYALTLAVGAAVFLLAYDYGSYDEVNRTTLAIGVWWAIVLAVAVGVRSVARLPAAALATGGLLLAFAVWTLLSTQWAADAGLAFAEGNRVLLYVGLFLLVVFVSPRGSAGRWADGIALGIAATAGLALASRLFPDVVSTTDFATVLPSAYQRLSYPLGYWNGLAIFTGIGFPLLLRAAVDSRYALLRGLALLPLPVLACVLYLTSSRGGFAVAFLGTFVFLLLTPRRWTALAAAIVAGVASVGAVAALHARTELVNDPYAAVAVGQGHRAALLVLGLAVLAAAIWAAATALVRDRLPESGGLEAAAVVVVVAAVAVGVALLHPLQRFDEFREPPPQSGQPQQTSVANHLTSGNGSGRWQLWSAALDENRSHRLHGGGAGSFASWWLRSPHFVGYAVDAHSLYAETLGELGVVGLVLLAGAFLSGLAAGLRRALAGREAAAALVAAFVAYAAGAAVDWMWELTAVSVVGVALLATLTGPASLAPVVRARTVLLPPRGLVIAAAVVVVAVGVAAVSFQGIRLGSTVKVQDSQAAMARNDPVAAADDALAARSLEPWSPQPYLQLALIEEQAGRLAAARRWIADAIERSPDDWELWLVRTRIETKLGRIRQAARSLHRCRALYPESELCGRA